MSPIRERALLGWVLRCGSAAIFGGHGWLALKVWPAWLPFFDAVGISLEWGRRLMPLVGALDLGLALLVLVSPRRAALLWMASWALWTALLRPISGMPVVEAVERGGNVATPLALLLLSGWPRRRKDWWAPIDPRGEQR